MKEEKNMLRKRIYAGKSWDGTASGRNHSIWNDSGSGFCRGADGTEAAMQSVLPNGREVYNVLLIGSDRRNDSWNGNSDVMIVMSVNAGSKKLSLTSFMRDLYADIPDMAFTS